jgi:maltoporin
VPGSTPQRERRCATNAAAAAKQFANEQFQYDTESRVRAVLDMEQPLRQRLEHVLQDFVDIHGYFRAGYGRDSQGGPQVAFQALARWRSQQRLQ